MPLHPWLDFDLADAAEGIPRKMREIVSATLLRRGCVVAVSGGIDSSVCAALRDRTSSTSSSLTRKWTLLCSDLMREGVRRWKWRIL